MTPSKRSQVVAMSDHSEDLRRALAEAADVSAPCERVLRYFEDKHVAVRPADFYQALKHVDDLVVHLDIDDVAPIDCRHNDGDVEFATDVYDEGKTTRQDFLDKVSAADTVSVIPSRESEFDGGLADDDQEVRADGGTQPVAGSDEVDDYLEKISGTWSDEDPEVLVFDQLDSRPVVAQVDGDLRCLNSGLVYPRQLSREGLIDAINEYGRPRADDLSNHEHRFDKSHFEDLPDDGGDK